MVVTRLIYGCSLVMFFFWLILVVASFGFIFAYQLKEEVVLTLMVYILDWNDIEILVKIGFYVIYFTFFFISEILICFKTPSYCRSKSTKCFMASAEFTDFFFLKKCRHFVRYQQFTTGLSRGYCWWHYWDWTLF